jgi:hypothetical protein
MKVSVEGRLQIGSHSEVAGWSAGKDAQSQFNEDKWKRYAQKNRHDAKNNLLRPGYKDFRHTALEDRVNERRNVLDHLDEYEQDSKHQERTHHRD